MTIGGKNQTDNIHYISIVNGTTEESDLGVVFTTDLNFSHYINNAIQKALRHAYSTHLTFIVYTSLVRSQVHLDYACMCCLATLPSQRY